MSPLGALPLPPILQGTPAPFTASWGGWFSTVQKILQATSNSGPTSQRPVATYVGQFYFDTTLGIPIWAKTIGNTTVWINASGATV
jgi:hypothetical protein